MDLGLANATAAVVGGSRGMGLATARCFAEEGARVAVVGRSREALDAAVTDLTQCGSPDAVGLTADVGDDGAVGDAFSELTRRWDGELNALVITVGPGAAGAFEDLTDDQWRQSVEDGVLGMVRCVRAALATSIVVLAGAVPLGADLFPRHALATATLFTLAAAFLPAVATWAASLLTHGIDALELATTVGGAPIRSEAKTTAPGSSSAILGALPGFASTVVIVLVIIASPWLRGNADTALPAPAVLVGLGAVSLVTLAAMRAAAPRVMGTILRDVSALDRQRLATLEIRPPTAIESAVARALGHDAGLVYRKDARLMRRRYPMAFALGALGFLVLAVVGLAKPNEPMPYIVVVLSGAVLYGAVLATRLRRPPIEIPRLAATLPIAGAALARAKLAWTVAWATIFVVISAAFAVLRLL